MSVLLLGRLSPDEWQAWRRALAEAMPGETLIADPAQADPARIDIALVANPPPGSLQRWPALRLIQSLWAGVDRLLADHTLPADVPIARMVDPAMNAAMAETALWAVLALHRGFFGYARQQAAALWQPGPCRRADELSVAVLGLGQMGSAVARRLAAQGYRVAGWRLHERAAPSETGSGGSGCSDTGFGDTGFSDTGLSDAGLSETGARGRGCSDIGAGAQGFSACAGPAALAGLLARSEVVVNLLPLTPATRGLLDARCFAALPRGAALVNLARGAHVVEADLLAALASGQLGHAVLDVFHTEPLPAGHPFWAHPQVTVLPHVAAPTDPRSAARVVAANVAALRAGQPLAHLVERRAGY